MKKGKFIVLEGGEGSGKGTMMNVAKENFGGSLLLTREPGGSPFAEEIRHLMRDHALSRDADANTQFGLIWASRATHLKDTVKPALLSGNNVLTDRFDSSTWAYQICGQEGWHLKEAFFVMQKLIVGDFSPNLFIFLDVLPEIGLKRKSGQQEGGAGNHFDMRAIDFHERVRSGYLEYLKNVPHAIIDANKSIDEVKAEFLKTLSAEISKSN
jgi:dTMP kinase